MSSPPNSSPPIPPPQPSPLKLYFLKYLGLSYLHTAFPIPPKTRPNFIKVPPLPPKYSWSVVLSAFIGSWLGIASIGAIHYMVPQFYAKKDENGLVAIVGSFGATAVLLYCAIDSALAQPRNVFGGSLIAAAVGVCCRHIFDVITYGTSAHESGLGYNFWRWIPAAFAVSLTIVFQMITRTVHPPGGAIALIATTGEKQIYSLQYLYIVFPVLSSLIITSLIALLVNNVIRVYPLYWINADEYRTLQSWWRKLKRCVTGRGKEKSEESDDREKAMQEIANRDRNYLNNTTQNLEHMGTAIALHMTPLPTESRLSLDRGITRKSMDSCHSFTQQSSRPRLSIDKSRRSLDEQRNRSPKTPIDRIRTDYDKKYSYSPVESNHMQSRLPTPRQSIDDGYSSEFYNGGQIQVPSSSPLKISTQSQSCSSSDSLEIGHDHINEQTLVINGSSQHGISPQQLKELKEYQEMRGSLKFYQDKCSALENEVRSLRKILGEGDKVMQSGESNPATSPVSA
ncbi:HPP family-domain-containing protein [Paraphysoderma sedebokerense]|nr:HPP family-domain-containing protein [Paraphysoderma sedebokerense]